MNTTTTHYCACCQRERPLAAFYINKQKQCPDSYCKECRKAASRKQRKADQNLQTVRNHELYPVITRIENRELRLSFILHALQVVAESQARKRKREQAYADEDVNL